MQRFHIGPWYSGTTSERLALSGARDGTFYHDTTLGTLFYLYNDTWYEAGGGYNPLICAEGDVHTALVTSVEQTMHSCTIPANTLQVGGSLQYDTQLESANSSATTIVVRLYMTSDSYDELIYESPSYVGNGTSFAANYRLHCAIIESGGAYSLVGLLVVTSDHQTTVPNVVTNIGVQLALDEDAELYLTVEKTSGAVTVAQRCAFVHVYRTSELYLY